MGTVIYVRYPSGDMSFDIGLTVLRKLAKQIGRDHALAMALWQSDVYDVQIIALLIDDPKLMTREQAEAEVEKLDHQGHLAHVFSSCNATLAKAPFVVELACDWIISKDSMRRRCGYGLLYEVPKSKKKSAPNDAFSLERIEHINKSFPDEELSGHHSMGVALMGIRMRNRRLHAAALKVDKKIGPIQIGSDESNCESFDVVKHLTSDFVAKKLRLYYTPTKYNMRHEPGCDFRVAVFEGNLNERTCLQPNHTRQQTRQSRVVELYVILLAGVPVILSQRFRKAFGLCSHQFRLYNVLAAF